MPDQARFLDFMDMIDGGGKGQMGDKFEGGGIFSALANLVATPYGSEDPARRARREAAYRAAGLLDTEEDMAAPAAAPAVTRTKPTREELMSARAAEMERQRGLQQDVFDPRGPNQMGASGFRNPTEGYPDMSMPAIAGYTTPTPAPEYRSMDQAVGGYQYPSMYRPMDRQVGLFQQAQGSPAPTNALTGGIVQPISGEVGNPPATPAPIVKGPNLYPSTGGSDISISPFSANPPSAAAMTPPAPLPEDRNPQLAAFNQAMATVPQMLQGTEIAQMYRDHLLNGGGGTFAQFTGAQ